jgi:hypothetical protein
MLTVVGTLLDRIDEVEADAEANASIIGHAAEDSSMDTDSYLAEKKKKMKRKHEKEAA